MISRIVYKFLFYTVIVARDIIQNFTSKRYYGAEKVQLVKQTNIILVLLYSLKHFLEIESICSAIVLNMLFLKCKF